MAEFLSDAMADDFRLVRSRIMVDAATGVYSMIRIPENALVTQIWIDIISAYGATSTIDVGFTGNKETADPNAFMILTNATVVPVTTAKLSSNILDVVSQIAGATSIDTLAAERHGKYFNSGSGVITLTLAKGNAAVTASCQLFASYCVII